MDLKVASSKLKEILKDANFVCFHKEVNLFSFPQCAVTKNLSWLDILEDKIPISLEGVSWMKLQQILEF